MSMRRKLQVALGAGLMLAMILSGVSGWSAWQWQSTIEGLMADQETTGQWADVARQGAQALSAERAIIVRLVLKDRAGVSQWERSYQEARSTALGQLAGLRRTGGRATGLAELESLMANWEGSHRHFREAAEQGKAEAAAGVMRQEIVSTAEAFIAKAAQLSSLEQRGAREAGAGAAASARWYLVISLVVAVLCMAAGGAGIWTARGGFNELAASLADMSRMAEEVTQAAGSVSSTSQALAVGASHQAASTEETAASSAEVKSMAQRNSQSASAAAQLVTDAQAKFDQAHHSLARMEDTMSGIEVSAGKIARIIKVIDDIAFQTNILSLNAAVEAARAGDAGMGFAVVADEVRGLAQRCATAARETAALIHEAIARSAEGKVVAMDVAGTIRSITTETLSIRTLVDEVSAGSEDQARSLDQIAGAIAQIERVTQDSAANAREAAAASEELTAQAAELRRIAQKLTQLTGAQERVRVTPKMPAPAPRKPGGKVAAAPFRKAGRPGPALMDDDDLDFRAF